MIFMTGVVPRMLGTGTWDTESLTGGLCWLTEGKVVRGLVLITGLCYVRCTLAGSPSSVGMLQVQPQARELKISLTVSPVKGPHEAGS